MRRLFAPSAGFVRIAAIAVIAAIAAVAPPVAGQTAAQPSPEIPERPEELHFESSTFEPPPVAGLRFELGNGLPVYVVPDRALPLVDIVLALPVGDRNEGPGEDGLASMTAAMARRGGAGALGPEELDDEIDALGARIVTNSSWSRTVLALDCGTEALDRGLELLASILFEPRFDDERLAQAKENLRVSLRAEADDPRAVLEREWLRLVHGPGSRRSRRLTDEAVAAFNGDALAGFHRRHWSPDGAVIAASGDVDPEALVARLDELFGGWAPSAPGVAGEAQVRARGVDAERLGVAAGRGEPPARPGARVGRPAASAGAVASAGDGASTGNAASTGGGEPAPVRAASPGWWTIRRPGAQTAIAIGHRGAPFESWDDPDRWALMLLTEILDGPGAVSRLRSRLQLEEGLTYRVLTFFDLDVRPAGEASAQTPRDPGEFRVFLETAPESAAVAAAAVLEELVQLRRDDVPAAEIATARESLLARLPLLFDRAESVAGRYAEDELLGRPHEYWAVYRERLLAVTAADIRRAAHRFLDPIGLAALAVGDLAAVRPGGGAEWRRLPAGRAPD